MKTENKYASFLNKVGSFVCSGYFYGKLFDLGDYPGAVIDIKSLNIVKGEIYKLNDIDSVFEILDKYEGFGAEFEKPNEFIRK